MEEEIKKILPLEFKNLKSKKKEFHTNINKKNYTEVDLYQSDKVIPENFFKPISKIITLEPY